MTLQIPRILRHTIAMNIRKFGSGAGTLRISLHFLLVVVLCHSVVAGESLFDDDGILDLTIRTPLKRLMRHSEGAANMTGSLELASGIVIPVVCNKYGISRLRECDLASLAFTVDPDDVRNTLFEGLEILRMVTPCRLRGDFDRYTVLEYLVYRSYALIAEPALRVRLVRARFHDSERPTKEQTGFAFFIEDIGRAAVRNGQIWLDIQSQRVSDLDPTQLTVMTLFQYMIGNTDWSAVAGRPDERCCHNVAAFGGEGGGLNTVVPFDFDQTGLVDPPYAAQPDASLGIRRVTDRKYRGLCEHNSELPAAIAVFNQKRSQITALFRQDELPYPQAREKALEYVDDFYGIINDRRKLERRIVRDCR
jgi:hypothetical protein